MTITAVLKFGGDVVAQPTALTAVLGDVATLTEQGWRFVLCHGGGPQANALADALGLVTNKVAGRRVTDEPTLRVMKQVLAGEVSVDVVAAAAGVGLKAVGLSGVSAGLVQASRRPPIVVPSVGEEPVDYGLVGKIERIDPSVLEHLHAGGYTPVMNTLGAEAGSPSGAVPAVYNINADTVASAVAAALGADHLFLMTGIGGVLEDRDDPESRIPVLSASEARRAMSTGVIVDGMIPKIEEALRNLQAGIGAVHILGPRGGALLAEAETPGSVGTALVPDDHPAAGEVGA